MTMHPGMTTDEALAEARRWRVVPERLRYLAETQPEAPFIQCDSPWLSFAEFEERTSRIAAGFTEIGVRRGDRVATIMPNRLETILTTFALAKLGAVQVPLNIYLKGDFLAYQISDSDARFLVVDPAGVKAVANIKAALPGLHGIVIADIARMEEPPQQTFADMAIHGFDALEASTGRFTPADLTMSDLMSIVYTSGTTGAPKGCMISQGCVMAAAWGDIWAGIAVPGDRFYTAMPLFHVAAGVLQLSQALVLGAPVSVDTAFSATHYLERATKAGATCTTMVPAMVNAILAQPEVPCERSHTLQRAKFGGSRPQETEQFENRFGIRTLTLGYGQTEGSGFTKAHIDFAKSKCGSIGRAGYGFDIALLAEDGTQVAQGAIGEIAVRPHEPEMMFQGYWRKPEATLKAFQHLWYHTGDLASMDEDGFFHFHGRKTDSLRRRGENVSAVELEDAIVKHPSIRMAAVHAVPSPMGEDDIKACLILEPDQAIDEAELFAFFRDNLPYFAIPRYVEVMAEFPVTPSKGTVMKHVLKELGVGNAIDFEALGLAVGKADRR